MWKVVVLVVLVVTVGRGDPHELHTQYPGFIPIHENYTQNLVELLLLRQDAHLSRLIDIEETVSGTLTNLATMVGQLKDAALAKQETQQTLRRDCVSPWSVVGSNCLLLAIADKMTWPEGRRYCSAKGGDLAIFPDANTFAEFLGYINSVNYENEAVAVFVGGGDEEVEGVWRWVNGEAMPRGPPFWGSTNDYKPEPGNGRSGNCAVLWHPDKYYLHDVSCTYLAAPLCQKTY